jgi:hypothetical protein
MASRWKFTIYFLVICKAQVKVAGYSALKIFDECYEYNENACYIADTPVSLKEFLDGAMLSVEDHRIESVSISGILNDFGYSSGEYALEPKALDKFERAAKEKGP